jgi:hypothetical protein
MSQYLSSKQPGAPYTIANCPPYSKQNDRKHPQKALIVPSLATVHNPFHEKETSEKQIPAKKIQSAEVQDNCYVRLAREEEP